MLALTAILVIARAVAFFAPGVRLDADQATVGLMAKHISEGRAFPVYFYGQSYLPALEAYAAAPLMWLLGPTETALKLPVLLMNVAAAVLLVWTAQRDLGLSPLLALVGALPVVVPPFVPGTRLMEAMGGNVETVLFAVLLWIARARPWAFGIVTAGALVQRELTVYPLLALLLLDARHRGWRSRATVERWALAAVLATMAAATLAMLRPFGAMYGPGTVAQTVDFETTSAKVVAAQICLDASRWPAHAAQLGREHLPMLVGGFPSHVSLIGVSSGIGQGNPGMATWVGLLCVAALIAALARSRPAAPPRSRGPVDGIPGTALPAFLILTGVISTMVYAFVSCSQITPNTLRYNLLGLFVPAGAILAGLAGGGRTVRAGLVTATLLWTAFSAADYGALLREIRSGRWPDTRAEVIRRLEARDLRALWGDYRLAYVIAFRSRERVVVAATESHRIDAYARGLPVTAPLLKQGTCSGGELLAGDVWLCPPRVP